MKINFKKIFTTSFIGLLFGSTQLSAGGYESCEEYAARRQVYLNGAEAGDPKAAFSLFQEHMFPCSTCSFWPLDHDRLKDPALGKSDYLESWKWLVRAADLGHPEAQYLVGRSHLIGDFYPDTRGKGRVRTPVIKANKNLALSYLELATHQDFPKALLFMGKLCEEGKCKKLDHPDPVWWFKRAAKLGVISAQRWLAKRALHTTAKKTADPVLAYLWLNLCRTDDAKKLAKRLSEAQRTEMEVRMQTWNPSEEARKCAEPDNFIYGVCIWN